MNQKLVAVMERLEEANNLKRELVQLQGQEVERVNQEVQHSHQLQLTKLAAVHQKRTNYFRDKYQAVQNHIYI